ncbi:MAG: VWA domain-containing protein [Gemmatimonadetes bacterium]|nr:VWA domain-containing protein [Gemmatimonadota bacterium]
MTFGRPELLVLALLGPAIAAVIIWRYAVRRKAVGRVLGDTTLVGRLGGMALFRFPVLRLALICAATLAIGIAAAGPRWGTREIEGRATSRTIMLALDASRSMLATDVEPDRMERQRLFVRRLLRELAGDRVGMIVFAGRAYVLSPLTVDHSALHLYLDALDPDVVSQGGSSLAAAIDHAVSLAVAENEIGGEPVILLVTDGEALEDETLVVDAADRAAQESIIVHAVGVGTEAGATIPERDPQTGAILGYKRDENGETVVSRMRPALLEQITRRTGGSLFLMGQGDVTDQVVGALGAVRRTASAAPGHIIEARERSGVFVLIALLCLALDAFLASRRARPRARVPAQAVALGLLVLLTSAAGIGDVERGNRLYRAGRYAEAAAAYEAAVRDGNDSPELRYNLGTALLRLGRYDDAETQFRAALDAVDPTLRERTLYNLGNRFLEAARASADAGGQGPLLRTAMEAYQRALRIDPTDQDAKWNLELSLREAERQASMPGASGNEGESEQDRQPDGGASGGGAGELQEGDEEQERAGPADRSPLSRDQAERILSAVEQDERELTRRTLRKGQRRTAVRRDW